MEIIQSKSLVLPWLKKRFSLLDVDADVLKKIHDTNFSRLYLLASLGMVFTFSFYLLFDLFTKPGSGVTETWRTGIKTVHLCLFIILFIILVLSLQRKKHTGNSLRLYESFLEYTVILAALIGCTFLTIIDQLVTASITPYLLSCVMVGLLVQIRPAVSIPLFTLSYALFYFFIDTYQTSASIVLSNKVNGFTAVVIGGFLSVTIWNSAVRNFSQQKHIFEQQKELERINHQLTILASCDGLTGLQNRRMLDTRLGEVLEDCTVHHTPLSIVLFDLDRFKEFNDLYGHVQGDDCLKNMSAMLLEKMKFDIDTVYRYGGEEFVLLLPDHSESEAFYTAEMVRNEILNLKIPHTKNSSVPFVSASFGVLTVEKVKGYTNLDILTKVDSLLYRAKDQGRNCSVQGIE
jgi:diguanylate cyclase (GGDEF)-like protein